MNCVSKEKFVDVLQYWSYLIATHKTNILILKGKLPEQKGLLLSKIDKAIEEYDQRRTRNNEIYKWKNWPLE